MLQKCDGCIGRGSTSTGEVPQPSRYLDRRGCPRRRAGARPGHIGAGELEAGSYELEAASWKLDRQAGS